MCLCACTWAPPQKQPLEKAAVLEGFVYVVREEVIRPVKVCQEFQLQEFFSETRRFVIAA